MEMSMADLPHRRRYADGDGLAAPIQRLTGLFLPVSRVSIHP
jgi:hypothetical protein